MIEVYRLWGLLHVLCVVFFIFVVFCLSSVIWLQRAVPRFDRQMELRLHTTIHRCFYRNSKLPLKCRVRLKMLNLERLYSSQCSKLGLLSNNYVTRVLKETCEVNGWVKTLLFYDYIPCLFMMICGRSDYCFFYELFQRLFTRTGG